MEIRGCKLQRDFSKKFAGPIAPQASVSATFVVTSGSETFNGDLVGKASWKNPASSQPKSETIAEKVRNVSPIKINEFRITAGSPDNITNSFIELYNAGNNTIDISDWTLSQHRTRLPVFSSVKIPAGTKIAARGFYLPGLSNSGLVVPAKKGESALYVRSTTGMSVGDEIEINSPLTATENAGTGLDLAEPLKFNHASNMPFSVRGTGISFTPATAFAHSSNEPSFHLEPESHLTNP